MKGTGEGEEQGKGKRKRKRKGKGKVVAAAAAACEESVRAGCLTQPVAPAAPLRALGKGGQKPCDPGPAHMLSAACAAVAEVGPGRPFLADGHTASNAPDLFRPPKLSGAGPG